MDFNIGPVSVAAITLAVTEALKNIFEIDGKWNQLIAVVVGAVLTGVSYAIGNNLIAESVIPYVYLVVVSLGGGLSAIGVFDFITKEINKIK